MEENKVLLVKVESYEYERLCRLDGCVDAVQRYIDGCEYPVLENVLMILGVSMKKMNERRNGRAEL